MAEVIRNNNNETKESRLVFKAEIARQLLHMGDKIIDIKPDRTNKVRTIFVFENDQKFQDDFNQVLNDIQDQRQKARRTDRKESDKETEKKED